MTDLIASDHCLFCGQRLPKKAWLVLDKEHRILSCNGVGLRLSSIEYRIIERMLQGPVTTRALVDYVYANDPQGGPEYAYGVITNTVCRTNRNLRKLFGYQIKSAGRGGGRASMGGVYALERVIHKKR